MAQPAFEGVEGPLPGDSDKQSAHENGRQGGEGAADQTPGDPYDYSNEDHTSGPGGVGGVGLHRFTDSGKLPAIRTLDDTQLDSLVNLAADTAEYSSLPGKHDLPRHRG